MAKELKSTQSKIEEQEAVIAECKQGCAGKRNNVKPKMRTAQETVLKLKVWLNLRFQYVLQVNVMIGGVISQVAELQETKMELMEQKMAYFEEQQNI